MSSSGTHNEFTMIYNRFLDKVIKTENEVFKIQIFNITIFAMEPSMSCYVSCNILSFFNSYLFYTSERDGVKHVLCSQIKIDCVAVDFICETRAIDSSSIFIRSINNVFLILVLR